MACRDAQIDHQYTISNTETKFLKTHSTEKYFFIHIVHNRSQAPFSALFRFIHL